MEKMINLEISGVDLDFKVTTTLYDQYVNEMSASRKITVAGKNFLMRCVLPESKEALKEVLEFPSASIHLVSSLVEEFVPDFEVTVGKSKPMQNQ